MRHLIYFLIPLLFVSAVLAASAWADTEGAPKRPVITIAADNWCPINCMLPELRKGVGIDLAKAIFEPMGFEINYKVMPWADALQKVREGSIDAVVGASRFDDRTLVFPDQPIYLITDDFYVNKGDGWRFQGAHTLKGRKLGVIAGYGYGKVMTAYIRENRGRTTIVQQATGEEALKENIRKLQERQIDVILESRPVMEYTLDRLRLDGQIIWAGSTPQAPVYLAFSPARSTSRQYAAWFDAGMRSMIARGQLASYYGPYGLSFTER